MIFSESVVNYKTLKMNFCSPKNNLLYSVQLCLILCNPMDCRLPGSSVHGISQARILEWVAMPSPRDLPDKGIGPKSPASPALAGRFFMLCHLLWLNTIIKTRGRVWKGGYNACDK